MSRNSAAWSDMIVLTMARASRMLFASPTNRFFSATQSDPSRLNRSHDDTDLAAYGAAPPATPV